MAAKGQEQGISAAPQKTPFTLHTSTRIVLTDVTVTDMQGHSVSGLDRSAFTILDNGQPQQIVSFNMHTRAATEESYVTPQSDGFSNDYLSHPPSVSNILFVDTTSMGLSEQSYAAAQLTQLVQELPIGEPLAICSREGLVVLIQQNFTSDHALLLAAVHRAIPILWQPDARYAKGGEALRQLANYLKDLPGRKNVLWFSAGSNFDLFPDASDLPDEANMRPIYDELEASRISVYPIDVRGLVVSGGRGLNWQHMKMDDVAEATGGRAFYNENGVAQIAKRVLEDDETFYTLTYAPHDLHFDNKWHKVRVEVGQYKLSYRHGYYDDGTNQVSPRENDRKVLRLDGQIMKLPTDHNQPIVFKISLSPSTESDEVQQPRNSDEMPPPKKGDTIYSVHFMLPASAFLPSTVGGKQQVVAGVVIVAINNSGRAVGRSFRIVTLAIDEQKPCAHPENTLAFNQDISLPKGQYYLRIAVWDTTTGRRGRIDMPLKVTERRH